MWGWKTVERHVSPAVPLDEARAMLAEQGFDEQSGDSRYATFKRDGTRVTTSGDKTELELAVAQSDSGLIVHVRYGAFVLFDTGDLERIGDELAQLLKN
jgi:hypothetical protein